MSIKFNEIKELIEFVEKTGITEFRLETSGTKVVIKKEGPVMAAPAAMPVPVQAAEIQETPVAAEATTAQEGDKLPENQVTINSPMVGTFYRAPRDRKSTRLNSSHVRISYAVFCLKKK